MFLSEWPASQRWPRLAAATLFQIHLYQLPVVGHQAVDLDLDIGGLRVNGGGQSLLLNERKELRDQVNVRQPSAPPRR